MSIKETLDEAMRLDGSVAAALVDYKSGMCLGTAGGNGIDLETAAAGNTEVVRSKMKVMGNLKLKDEIEDILITLGRQYHLIRVLKSHPSLFLYLVLKKDQANLALARYKLADVENNLTI